MVSTLLVFCQRSAGSLHDLGYLPVWFTSSKTYDQLDYDHPSAGSWKTSWLHFSPEIVQLTWNALKCPSEINFLWEKQKSMMVYIQTLLFPDGSL